jgi:alcohol dehydrogenase class IV
MRFFLATRPEPLQRIAETLGAIPGRPETAADAVQMLIAELGLPQHIAAFGLSREDLAEAVKPLATPDLPERELLAIMNAAY